ncbi:CocE/NonD family hydrolase [Nitrospira sp. M1]
MMIAFHNTVVTISRTLRLWDPKVSLLTLACAILCSGSLDSVSAHTDAAQSIPRPYHGNASLEHSEYTRFSRYLTMRDGVRIAITVYQPSKKKKGTRHPTILHQTRYWRSIDYRWPMSLFKDKKPRGLMGIYATRFLANGYVWVDVDVRGSGASFGSRPYAYAPKEIQDGADIVEWLIQQPWSNGRVGALGISYAGAAAEMLLVNKHPAVKAVAPLFSGYDLYPEIAFPGGIHLSWFTKTWTYINNQLDQNQLPFSSWIAQAFVHGVSPVDEDNGRSRLNSALTEHHVNWSPHTQALALTFRDDIPLSKAIPSIDNLSTLHYANEIADSGAAIYSYSGWLDGGYQLAAIKRQLRHNTSANKLIVGPWDHGGKQNISPFNSGPSAFDHQGELLKFFDYHLQDIDTGIQNEAPIHYFTMGKERWNASDIWPPAARNFQYYFGTDHQLTAHHLEEDTGTDQYVANTSVGTGHNSRWDTLIGKSLDTPYADRNQKPEHLLLYTSMPLERSMEVTGHPLVTLYLSANTTDATIFAYLEDIDETGTATYVTEGQLRALHRKVVTSPKYYPSGIPYRTFTRQHASPLIPGTVAKLSFDLLPTSYQFQQDHQIRLTIAGADKDHFAVLPGKNPTLTIHRATPYPSHLILPVVD